MQKITRIGPLSLGKLIGGVAATFGLFFGLIFSAASLLGAAFASTGQFPNEGLIGILFGVGALFVLPIVYGCFGFIQGVLVGLIANVAMRFFGGLEVEIV